MYRILIVEDEPPIARYIKSITEMVTEQFEIVGVAEDGIEALEKMEALNPDVVLTDVKMPRLNGVELIKRLKTDYPELFTVIISGYQDFEYAREAIKWGAFDYLLKPIEPEQFKQLLSLLAIKLDRDYHTRASELLRQFISNLPVDERKASKFLDFSQFFMILVRRGTLPARFVNMPLDFKSADTFPEFDLEKFAHELKCQNIWLSAGRDEAEFYLVMSTDGDRKFNAKFAAEVVMQLFAKHDPFYTMVYSSKSISLQDMAVHSNTLVAQLNQHCTLGRSQIVDIDKLPTTDVRELPNMDNAEENQLVFFISNMQTEHLKSTLHKIFSRWEKQSCTQMELEKAIRHILSLVEKHTINLSPKSGLNTERRLDQALFYANDYSSLFKAILNIVDDLICISDTKHLDYKQISDGLLSQVEVYIQKNLAESISLQGVCDQMGISQTYLSRLFRKKLNMSFNEYLTHVRIMEAKRLIVEHPEMLLKDIAAIVGYRDSHYFSRIFKTITGSAPSSYSD